MKNKKNKILAATACGVIVTSIGAGLLFNKYNNDNKDDITKDIEEVESEDIEETNEEQEVVKEDTENIVEEDIIEAEENVANSESTVSNNNNNVSNNSSTTTDVSQSVVNNNTNNSQTGSETVEEPKEEVSNGSGNSNSTTNEVVESTSKYKDGTYSGSASGFAGTLQVSVQISNDVITSITVTSHNETEGFADRAIAEIPSKIISSQSTSVDVVSGATYTSNGIINAVSNALNAGKR